MRKSNHLHYNVRKIGVAKITSLSVQESADREPTSRNYTKIAPAITPTTAAAMEPQTPLPMLLPKAPFPLKELAEAEDEDEVPVEEPLEPDEADVTVTPNPVVDEVLRAEVVTEPDESEVEFEDEAEVEAAVELVVLAGAPIEKSPLVPKTELILLISTASIV